MNFWLNDDQWDFIFQYYPEYAQSPYSMISWLGDCANQKEYEREEEVDENTFCTISEWMN